MWKRPWTATDEPRGAGKGTSWVASASILHSNGDAMDIAVKDDRIVGVRLPRRWC